MKFRPPMNKGIKIDTYYTSTPFPVGETIEKLVVIM